MPVDSADAGYVVVGLLNSLPVRCYGSAFAESARGAYLRYISWVLGMVPLPAEVEALLSGRVEEVPASLGRLLEISKALHEDATRSNRAALEEELDGEVGRLYGLGGADLRALRDYFTFIRANTPPDAPPDEEEEGS